MIKFYILDMIKERWEISVYDGKKLMISQRYIEQMKNNTIVSYNEHYFLCKDKLKLIEFAHKTINNKVDKLMEQIQYYNDMKIKITRK